jgi:predicted nucleic acid-binding protein
VSNPLLLADKSALARGARPKDFDAELCLCPVIRMELLYSARSALEYARMRERLDRDFRSLRMDAETFEIADSAQRELAERGQHRIPIPDLLIGACAHQHAAGVLHVDRHYDVLAHVLTIDSVRLEHAD